MALASCTGLGWLDLGHGSVTSSPERSFLAMCSKSIAPTLVFEPASVPWANAPLRLNSAFSIIKVLELTVLEVEQKLRLERPGTTELSY